MQGKGEGYGGIIWEKYTNRTRFTRMCIGEAVFSLMDKKII